LKRERSTCDSEDFVTSTTNADTAGQAVVVPLNQSSEYCLGFEAGAEDRLGVDAEPAF
jgi:hypothetical protein